MNSLFILIPIALVLVAIAVRVFIWAVKSGQFEDLDTEGKRILFDDAKSDKAPTKPSNADLLSTSESAGKVDKLADDLVKRG
ncbi:MAG: cbb3-type cytochrome oxidase assembly protein CcoS [Agarilytica sp.]